MPLRERNRLLLAAGYAPVYQERPLADPALAAARQAVERVLAGHEPYPALAVDRHWTLVAANRALAPLLAGIAAELLAPHFGSGLEHPVQPGEPCRLLGREPLACSRQRQEYQHESATACDAIHPGSSLPAAGPPPPQRAAAGIRSDR